MNLCKFLSRNLLKVATKYQSAKSMRIRKSIQTESLIESFRYESSDNNNGNEALKESFTPKKKSKVIVESSIKNDSENQVVLRAIPKSTVSSRSEKKKKSVKLEDIEECATNVDLPENFDLIWNGILEMRKERNAPVDILGCDRLSGDCDTPMQRFSYPAKRKISKQLVGLYKFIQMEFLQIACVRRLRAIESSPVKLSQMKEDELANILKGVGFHRTKARNLIRISKILLEKYDGDIPSRYEELCELPGVGSKMALITMNAAWGEVKGIAVDVHVHRICNRLNFVKKKTPEGTCVQLAKVIPRNLWKDLNLVFVGFGQQICKSDPLCEQCLVRSYCSFGKTYITKAEKKQSQDLSKIV